MMNGALYISFFQGQLESAMEQVVQLAVQEITKTVGSSLNSMLQETTAKDQDNQRLRLKLQSRQADCGGVGNASVSSEGKMEGNEASDGTKSQPHTPSQSTEHAVHTNTHWLEQKGRAVGQLKVVMEQVLKFAVCELTKIVEDSFDDLLLEMMKKEKENKDLNLRLQQTQDLPDSGKDRAKSGKALEKASGSPSNVGSSERDEEAQESLGSLEFGADVFQAKKPTEAATVPEKQTVLSVSQDWVPILDKVFGQKWCSDLWQVKEMGGGAGETGAGAGAASFPNPECYLQERVDSPLVSSTLLEEGPGDGEGKLPWLQPEQMEGNSAGADFKGAAGVSTTGCLSPVTSDGHHHSGEDSQLRSPSMLHRLLTLPSQGLGQLLCDDPSIEPLPAQAEVSPDIPELRADVKSPTKDPASSPSEEDEEEGGGPAANCSPPEPKCRASAGRKTYPCRQCGKKFGRLPLLKMHQQTHREASPVSCTSCGKRFTQASRLQAHQRTHVGKKS
ncbi:hypermethylated in cancer 2 protein [Megalops cyprinoides]|uniref:hypermethylated in cancer 2 protein n=1 Tax=Megalops cyprinoides TaxID=118141 RepID=UPI001863A339|nr:hypermethylated in cancer 2 protein [Megalops cyprinoides]